MAYNPIPKYTEGDIDPTITGVAIMWEDASDTLRSVSAAKPLPVNIVAGSSSGTEYTEDAAAVANPAGGANILIRTDTPATQVSADGDNIAQRGTNYGAAYVQLVTSAGSYIDSVGGGVQYTEADVDTTITGTAMMWEDASDTLRAVSAAKPLPVNIVSGSSSGVQYTEGDIDATITGTAIMMEVAADTLQPIQGTVTDGLLVNLGTNNDITGTVTANAGTGTFAISAASLPLPSGAATEATLSTIDTDTGVIASDTTSIDSKTPALGQALGSASVPVVLTTAQITTLTPQTDSLTDAQLRATAVPISASSLPLPNGAATAANQQTDALTDTQLRATAVPVSLASVPSHAVTNAGTFTVQEDGAALTSLQLIDDPIATIGTTPLQRVAIFDASDTQITSFGGGIQYTVDTALGATPTGTLGIAIRDDVLTTLTPIDGDAVGQRVNSKGALWTTVDGTVTVDGSGVTQPISAASLPLPTSASTSTKQSDGSQKTQIVDGVGAVIGSTGNALDVNIASGSSSGTEYSEDVATPATIVGGATLMERDDALTTVTPIEGDWIGLRGTAEGALWTQDFNSDQMRADLTTLAGAVSTQMQVDVVGALPAGTNNIGDVNIASSVALDVSAATVTVDLGVNNDVTTTGNVAHDAADTGNPVKIGHKAIAHGTNPTAVAASDRTDWYANRAGVPFVIGGHPNIKTFRANYTAAQTDTAIITITTGLKIVVTRCTITADNANTVDVQARIGFGATTTPTGSGVVLSHPGIAAGSGVSEGSGSGILGVGADNEDLRITSEVPTTGSIDVVVSYYTIES